MHWKMFSYNRFNKESFVKGRKQFKIKSYLGISTKEEDFPTIENDFLITWKMTFHEKKS